MEEPEYQVNNNDLLQVTGKGLSINVVSISSIIRQLLPSNIYHEYGNWNI
jgi:hypothetical protein